MAKRKKKTSAANGSMTTGMIREPAEQRFAAELTALESADDRAKPAGWRLSPRAVRTFICGSDGESIGGVVIPRKFYGDDVLVERAIVTLASNRGLMMVGEPGTAKSMLSELLAAAVSQTSTLAIQGTAATTEDQIRYSWNYALLLAEGPTPRALVPSPLYTGMKQGQLVRFEEITRCPPEVQDTLVSILSEKVLMVPELEGDDSILFAQPGFNIIGTANTRDRGVHEMSTALKRRFNFETVQPIADPEEEVALVQRESGRLLDESGVDVDVTRDVIEVLVDVFRDLRSGMTSDGMQVERASTVLSTAEAVSVTMSAGLDASFYGDGQLGAASIARHLVGAVLKDNADDLEKLRHYFNTVVKKRSQSVKGVWADLHRARKWLPR